MEALKAMSRAWKELKEAVKTRKEISERQKAVTKIAKLHNSPTLGKRLLLGLAKSSSSSSATPNTKQKKLLRNLRKIHSADLENRTARVVRKKQEAPSKPFTGIVSAAQAPRCRIYSGSTLPLNHPKETASAVRKTEDEEILEGLAEARLEEKKKELAEECEAQKKEESLGDESFEEEKHEEDEEYGIDKKAAEYIAMFRRWLRRERLQSLQPDACSHSSSSCGF